MGPRVLSKPWPTPRTTGSVVYIQCHTANVVLSILLRLLIIDINHATNVNRSMSFVRTNDQVSMDSMHEDPGVVTMNV